MITYKFQCPQCNTIYTRTDNPLNHFCENCKEATILLQQTVKHGKMKKKGQEEEYSEINSERICRAVERAFKGLVTLYKLKASNPKINQNKEPTKVLQQWERLFNSRKVIIKGFIKERLIWAGLPDKYIDEMQIDNKEKGRGKEQKELNRIVDNHLRKGSKGYTLSDLIFDDIWCWCLGRIDLIQERGDIFEDNYLKDKKSLFAGEKKRLLSIPYKDCKESGSVYSIFDKFTKMEAEYLKWQFEYNIITSGIKEKMEVFEGELEDKKDEPYRFDEQDEQNTEQLLDTREPKEPTATGWKPDLIYSPEEIYIGKETRQEILIESRGVRRNLQTEALQEALDVWQKKKADLVMYPSIEAYMNTEGADSLLWRYFASMDIKAFTDLFKTMEGIEPFPKTREEVIEAHVLSEIRKHDLVTENLDAKLKGTLDKHRTDIKGKPLQKKLKHRGEKGFSYVHEPTQARKETEGMQFQNKGLVEFSQKLNAKEIYRLIKKDGGTSIEYSGWKKHFKKYEEEKSWINFFDKLDLVEAMELTEKFQDGITIKHTDDIDIEGFDEIKSCIVVKTQGFFQAMHPHTIDEVKEKSKCSDVHLEPARDHIKQNCLKIIANRILERMIAERKAEIEKEKRIARKSKLEHYNEDKEAEYAMEIDNYSHHAEINPSNEDYKKVQAKRVKHRKERSKIEAKIKPHKRSGKIQVQIVRQQEEQLPHCYEENKHGDTIKRFKNRRGKEYFGEFCKCGEQLEYQIERMQIQAVDKHKDCKYIRLPIWDLIYSVGWNGLQQLSIDHKNTDIPVSYEAYYKEWLPRWLERQKKNTMDIIAKPAPEYEDTEQITVNLVCPRCGHKAFKSIMNGYKPKKSKFFYDYLLNIYE